MPRYELVVFDLDGTLVDSLDDLTSSLNVLLGELGLDTLDSRAVGAMVGDGAATLVRRAFAAAGRPAPDDALARFLAIYDGRLLDRTRPYPEVAAVLAALAATRPLAVLTNKPLAATRRILDGLDLGRYFDTAAVFGGDGPLPRKPNPAGLLQLAAAAGVRADRSILVGDSRVDQRTARAAGSGLCLARYGFGFDRGAIAVAGDELVVDTPRELLDIL